MSTRTPCPRCNTGVRMRQDGAYGTHMHGRSYCTTSGLTPAEVREGKTALGKALIDFLTEQVQEQSSPSKGDQVT